MILQTDMEIQSCFSFSVYGCVVMQAERWHAADLSTWPYGDSHSCSYALKYLATPCRKHPCYLDLETNHFIAEELRLWSVTEEHPTFTSRPAPSLITVTATKCRLPWQKVPRLFFATSLLQNKLEPTFLGLWLLTTPEPS